MNKNPYARAFLLVELLFSPVIHTPALGTRWKSLRDCARLLSPRAPPRLGYTFQAFHDSRVSPGSHLLHLPSSLSRRTAGRTKHYRSAPTSRCASVTSNWAKPRPPRASPHQAGAPPPLLVANRSPDHCHPRSRPGKRRPPRRFHALSPRVSYQMEPP